MNLQDLIIFTLIFPAILFMILKAKHNYKLLTSETIDKIYVNPKNFIWKAGVFLFTTFLLIPFSVRKDISTYLLFSCLLGIGLVNVYYAVKYRNHIKKY